MAENANKQILEWTADVMDIFIPPEWPWVARPIGSRAWDDWISKDECLGQWETMDPFPRRIQLMWDEIYILHAPELFRNGNSALRAKLLKEWEQRFCSALIRLQISDIRLVNHFLEPEHPVPSDSHFVGSGQAAQIQQWRGAACSHKGHPHVGCALFAREVVPVKPRHNMNYWFAQVQDGNCLFNAVLEAPLRVDLGARGPVHVCRAQQVLEWYLPSAARLLDRHWHQLPNMIARSQIDDLFFRSSRSRLRPSFSSTEE